MSDSLIQQLENDLAALRRQLEETEIYKDIKAIERVMQRLQKARHPSQHSPQHKLDRARTPMIAASSHMRNAAFEVLKGQETPLSTKEIYESLQQQGVDVPGENPANNLSAHLSRDERFLSWGREGWTLEAVVAPQLDKLDFIVREFAAQITAEAREELVAQALQNGEIPADTDRELLRAARTYLGRHLTSVEKDTARSKLRQHFDLDILL